MNTNAFILMHINPIIFVIVLILYKNKQSHAKYDLNKLTLGNWALQFSAL